MDIRLFCPHTHAKSVVLYVELNAVLLNLFTVAAVWCYFAAVSLLSVSSVF